MYELKFYRNVMCHNNDQLCKVWKGIDLSVLKLTLEIWHILNQVLANLKNFHFFRLLLTKAYNVWAKKKYKGVARWHWRLSQNLKEN